MKILLNSGGIDSNYSNFKNINLSFFIENNNCKNFLDKKYSIFNCKLLKKKIFCINIKNEYNLLINFFNNFYNINIDFYCNKLIKIYLIKFYLKKKKIFSGHYIKRIFSFFILPIDQKKDQSFFLNYKNIIYSIIGYFNKKIIYFISFKNNFICKKKKNTTGICFDFIIKKKKNIFFLENKMIIKIFKKNFLNLGKKIFKLKIIKIKNEKIFLTNYLNYFFFKTIIIEKTILKKNIFFKINSQSLKIKGKIITRKKNTFIVFYKNQKFLEKNILIFYNDLIICNSKIKKKY